MQISLFYTSAPKTPMIWDIECDGLKLVILGHFLNFYSPKTLKNQNFEKKKKRKKKMLVLLLMCTKNCIQMMHGSWDTYGVRQTYFVCHFLPFYSPNDPENQIFERMKKISEDIILLHMCTINKDHLMCDSWNIRCGRQNVLSFWTIFCPFTTLTTQKIKILKSWRKHLEILSSCTWAP